MNEPVEIPEFGTAEEALSYAFRMEGKLIHPKNIYETVIKGTNPADLTIQDKIIQGSMIRACAFEAMLPIQIKIIIAEFTMPVNDLYNKKEMALAGLANLFKKDTDRAIDKHFVIDTLRLSLSNRSHHAINWWIQHTSTPSRTMYRVAKEIKEFSETWQGSALNHASVNLAGKGYIP